MPPAVEGPPGPWSLDGAITSLDRFISFGRYLDVSSCDDSSPLAFAGTEFVRVKEPCSPCEELASEPDTGLCRSRTGICALPIIGERKRERRDRMR
jgi:hypothetical protein